ncbi:tyrosine-type recombinase/integrase [Planctomyces sp. SH-PL14]|uniref:tyrosine-type recombinase/integrase n=1 Tax=Planctomyces sp. SH-PL14 TaxID=1632864 RepID=UPI00078C7B85|nr:tyrosine-type recombinase/integrase [Planctomyces sp. SH-PL14]AMV22632.1 Tyrosine recombinase XerC [Planctomyces sp. SH-PL14]
MTGPTLIQESGRVGLLTPPAPQIIIEAGTAASFAWDEFFSATIRNPHTRAAYRRAVLRFLNWMGPFDLPLARITPAHVGRFLDEYPGSVPSRKLALAALRAFFDLMAVRQAIFLNPAASVRGERYQVVEGKTPEISKQQLRELFASFDLTRPVGLRDRAIMATLVYTAARDGAVAALRLGDLQWDGTQYHLRFSEKGGKSRLIPVRHDLQSYLVEYLASFDWKASPKDSPLFRSVAGRTGALTSKPIRNVDICRMMKRRLRDAGLPLHLSPHSCRVATVTNLLEENVPLEDVQFLAGHADPRTTRLYDRRQRKVTRNTVEKISL